MAKKLDKKNKEIQGVMQEVERERLLLSRNGERFPSGLKECGNVIMMDVILIIPEGCEQLIVYHSSMLIYVRR
jgi:hypothetical protein